MIKLPVAEIKQETSDSISIYFNVSNGEIQDFYPGQFLTLVLDVNGQNIRRSYSICTAPSELPRIGVCVKRVENGLASNHLADNLKVGDELTLIEPYGNFNLNHKLEKLPTIVLFGAGSGITPLMSILKSALEIDGNNTVHLFYGNSNEDSIIFKDELDTIKTKHPNRFHLNHILSRPSGNWDGVKTRLTKDFSKQLLDFTGLLNDETANYYVCGPNGMMENVLECLNDLNIEATRIHKESFYTELPSEAEKTEELQEALGEENIPDERKVIVRFEGEDHEIIVPKGEYILDCALDEGLDLPFACQSGICGMCRAKKVQGKMLIHEQEALSESEIEAGDCLTCCAEPLSDDLIIDYDS